MDNSNEKQKKLFGNFQFPQTFAGGYWLYALKIFRLNKRK